MHAAADTPRNRRIDTLAGCTTLARELGFARVGVNEALASHRRAQVRASKAWASKTDAKPASTRAHVRKAIARVHAVALLIEATYGDRLPVLSLKVAA